MACMPEGTTHFFGGLVVEKRPLGNIRKSSIMVDFEDAFFPNTFSHLIYESVVPNNDYCFCFLLNLLCALGSGIQN